MTPELSAFDVALIRHMTARAISESLPDNEQRRLPDGRYLVDAAGDDAGDAFFDLVGTEADNLVDVLVKADLIAQRGGDASLWEDTFLPAIVADIKRLLADGYAEHAQTSARAGGAS